MADEGNERHAAARCVSMLIQHQDDLLIARTVSDKNTGGGEKDVMVATTSVVRYLNSPVVQELSKFIQTRLVPFTDQDGTVTEVASHDVPSFETWGAYSFHIGFAIVYSRYYYGPCTPYGGL